MRIEGEYLFNGPRDEVWAILRDPEVLATALPGTKSLEKAAENDYKGEMNVRIGPVAGLFAGRLVVSNEIALQSCTLTVEGRGSPGFANGAGNVTLSDQSDGTTLMKYEGDLQIGGKLASVGQRLLDTASKSMIHQGLEALNMALEARVAARVEGTKLEYQPPSEGKFIAAVAKEMAGEMISSSRTVWTIIAIIVIIAIILGVWIKSHSGG